MLFLALRRLAGLMIAFALITAVVDHGGTGLAARSMTGFVSAFDAAQHGDYATADRISGDLAQQWEHLRRQAVQVLQEAETLVTDLAPR